MIKKSLEKYLLCIYIIGIVIFQMYWITKFAFFVQSDDFGYIANTAFFAGYNWNNYTGDMTPYYNIGFSWIPAFFLRFVDSFDDIYKILLVYILCLQLILLILVYNILIRFFKAKKNEASFVALFYTMSSFSPQNAQYYMSEIPFALCNLLLIYIMLSAIEATKTKKNICSVLCALILAYSYSVHTRFLVTITVFFMIVFCYQIIYHKKLINYMIFLICFFIGFLVVTCWVKYVQGTLYKPSSISGIMTGNDAMTRLEYIPSYIQLFLKWDNWKYFVLNFSALLASYTLITGGLIWTVIIDNIHYIYTFFKKERHDCNPSILLIVLFGLISFLGMNILIAANGVADLGNVKWLTYFRYAKPYVGLLIITSGLQIFRNEYNCKIRTFSLWGVLYSVLIIINYMIPYMTKNSGLDYVGWMRYFFYNGQTIKDYYLLFSLIIMGLYLGLMILMKMRKGKQVLVLLLIYSILLIISENQYNMHVSERNYKMVDGTYEYVMNYKDKINIPIYFMQGTYTGKLRYILFKHNMQYVYSGKELKTIDYENAILFSDNIDLFVGLSVTPKYCFELDDFEYLYTSNQFLYEEMIEDYVIVEE